MGSYGRSWRSFATERAVGRDAHGRDPAEREIADGDVAAACLPALRRGDDESADVAGPPKPLASFRVCGDITSMQPQSDGVAGRCRCG